MLLQRAQRAPRFVNKEGCETMEIKYDKLVRDRIPEIITAAGKTCVTETLSDEAYLLKASPHNYSHASCLPIVPSYLPKMLDNTPSIACAF